MKAILLSTLLAFSSSAFAGPKYDCHFADDTLRLDIRENSTMGLSSKKKGWTVDLKWNQARSSSEVVYFEGALRALVSLKFTTAFEPTIFQGPKTARGYLQIGADNENHERLLMNCTLVSRN